MSDLIPFEFGSKPLRALNINGEPWFIAADVCETLAFAHPSSSLRRLDDDEKGVHTTHTLGGPQEMTIINEAGLYSLILASRKPEAKRLKKWVTSEVLPAIRKTGTYTLEPQPASRELPRIKRYDFPLVPVAQAKSPILEALKKRPAHDAPDYDCPLWRLLDELSRDGSDVGACLDVYRRMKKIVLAVDDVAREAQDTLGKLRYLGRQ
jgi:hypothetical protein